MGGRPVRQVLAAVLGLVFILVIVVPALLVRGCDFTAPGRLAAPVLGGLPVRLYVVEENRVVELPLEEYVAGVVAAEMPARFALEALKAQAVVARTYTLRRMKMFGGRGCDKHPQGEICTDPAHSQAWMSREDARRRWGILNFYRFWPRIEQAVRETEGLMITYQGQPVDPVYHSTSGGVTENSEDVWEKAIPYLRSVPSPNEEHSPRFRQEVVLSWQEISRRTGGDLATPAAGGGRPQLEVLERSSTGRIKKLRLGDRMLNGREIRERLGLPSTWFDWEVQGEQVRFRVKGYGHGVGMSQYGADGLAQEGKDYREIIKHYYTGVEIEPIFLE